MTTYDISGNMVTISNDMENERYLLSTTDEYIESVNETFDEWYAARGSCYGIVEETDNLYISPRNSLPTEGSGRF